MSKLDSMRLLRDRDIIERRTDAVLARLGEIVDAAEPNEYGAERVALENELERLLESLSAIAKLRGDR